MRNVFRLLAVTAIVSVVVMIPHVPAAHGTTTFSGAWLDGEADNEQSGGQTFELPTVTYEGLYAGYPTFAAQGTDHNASFSFAAPPGEQLTPGTYEDAQRAAFRDPGHPGLDVARDSAGCNEVAGRFMIDEVTYDSNGDVLTFAARFEQHCEGVGPAMFGYLYYNASTAHRSRTLSANQLTMSTQDGAPESQQVTVTNDGPATLHVESVAASPSDSFTVSGNTCSATLSAGESCTITVTFARSTDGTIFGRLSFADELAPLGSANEPANAGTGRDIVLMGTNYGSGQIPHQDVGAYRIAGNDRIETAIGTSEDAFDDDSAGAVVLSRSDFFADALAGTPLAVAVGGPLLLNPSTLLDGRVSQELQRVLPDGGIVVLLGGTQALGSGVESSLAGMGFHVQRIAGGNRFETAVQVADTISPDGDPAAIFLATGLDYPDALSAGAAASAIDGVVLLTNGASTAPATDGYIAAHNGAPRNCLGGPACAAYPASTQIVGQDRYDTSAKAAAAFFDRPQAVGIASGRGFADALSGGAHIGGFGPLLLTDTDSVPDPTAAYLSDNSDTLVVAAVYGGTNGVSDDVLDEIDGLIRQ